MFSAEFRHFNWILHVIPILSDNYAYVWEGVDSCVIIDPGEAEPLLKKVEEIDKPCLQVVVTHGHHDHIDGLEACLEETSAEAWGAAGLPVHGLFEGDEVVLAGCPFEVIETPGHIAQQIALYSKAVKLAFVADAMFVGGCGRLFTRDAALMWSSLEKLKALPEETVLYCGHEYTVSNLCFAEGVFSGYKELAEHRGKMQGLLRDGLPTVPTRLGQELSTNMFLRCNESGVKEVLGCPAASDAEAFAVLRKLKDLS